MVQLYVHEQRPVLIRPDKELKGFFKVALNPGEEKVVQFKLDKRAFAFYSVESHAWLVNSGFFDILVGNSSRNLPLKVTIKVEAEKLSCAAQSRLSLKRVQKSSQGVLILNASSRLRLRPVRS